MTEWNDRKYCILWTSPFSLIHLLGSEQPCHRDAHELLPSRKSQLIIIYSETPRILAIVV